MNWLREDGILTPDILSLDSRLVYEHCGMDTLIKLMLHLPSVNLFISHKSLNEARRRYIERYHQDKAAKEIAVIIGASERFVYDAIREISEE